MTDATSLGPMRHVTASVCFVVADDSLVDAAMTGDPALEIAPKVDHAGVVITDGDLSFGDRIVVRVDSAGDGFHISRAAFLSDPRGVLDLARMAAQQRRALADAQREVEFARHLRELMSLGDLSTVFGKVAQEAISLSEAAWATILLHDPVIERFAVAYSNDPEVKEDGDYLPGIPPDVLQQAISSLTGAAIRPATAQRGALLVVPLRLADDLLGVVTLCSARGNDLDGERAERAASYLLTIGPFLVTVHQLSRSRDLALRDDLTKAYNRRFFDAHLDEEIERARRYNSLVSVIFLDLDDLKLVNNLYGHLSGSRMLQEVARRILGAVRAIDKVVRFGGDEFCIVLPQTDPEQAKAVALRVRRAMGERKFTLEQGVELPMTASFGIATYPVHAQTKEDLIRAADNAMYSVKSTSKNSIEVAPDPEAPHARSSETISEGEGTR